MNAEISQPADHTEVARDATAKDLEIISADLVLTPEAIERILRGWIDGQ